MLFWHSKKSKKFEKILRKTVEGFEIRNYEIFESYNSRAFAEEKALEKVI